MTFETRPRALVRRPGPRLTEGLVTHIDRHPVDADLAQRQWEDYVRALQDAGWETVEVGPADDCPDAVFVEDAVVVYADLAVLTRPGAPSRRGELEAVERAVGEAGYRTARIEAPGTLDGGDVLKWGGTVWVGLGGRTDEEGMQQLAAHLETLDARVVGVPVSKVLHLKSAVTALPDGTVVGHPPLVDDPTVWDRFLDVQEESGAHVVLLGGDRLLMAADAPHTAERFRAMGWSVTEVDISEFIKLEGCVTCLSVRLRG